jgi:hypothetical protein
VIERRLVRYGRQRVDLTGVLIHGQRVSVSLVEIATRRWSWAWTSPTPWGYRSGTGSALSEPDARAAAIESARKNVI